jgi:hypothetical protein
LPAAPDPLAVTLYYMVVGANLLHERSSGERERVKIHGETQIIRLPVPDSTEWSAGHAVAVVTAVDEHRLVVSA